MSDGNEAACNENWRWPRIWLFWFLLFIAGDLLSFEYFGATFRVANFLSIPLILSVVLRPGFQLPTRRVALFAALMVFLSATVLTSHAPFRSVGYFVYIGYLILVFFFIFPQIPRPVLLEEVRRSHVAVALLAILVWVISYLGFFMPEAMDFDRGYHRVNLWTYEPGYLATYMAPYLTFLIFSTTDLTDRRRLLDIGIIFTATVLTFSLTGLAALAIIGIMLLPRLRFLRLDRIKTPVGMVSTAVILAVAGFYLNYLLARLHVTRLMDVGGGRYYQYEKMWAVFLEHPLVGYGLNAIQNTPEFWLSNVTLEVLATGGLVLMVFLCWILFYAFASFKDRPDAILNALKLALLLQLIILQFNQNYIRLYTWLYLGLIVAGTRFEPERIWEYLRKALPRSLTR